MPSGQVRNLYQIYSPWPTDSPELLALLLPAVQCSAESVRETIKSSIQKQVVLNKTIVAMSYRLDSEELAKLFSMFEAQDWGPGCVPHEKYYAKMSIPYFRDIISNTVPQKLNKISTPHILTLLRHATPLGMQLLEHLHEADRQNHLTSIETKSFIELFCVNEDLASNLFKQLPEARMQEILLEMQQCDWCRIIISTQHSLIFLLSKANESTQESIVPIFNDLQQNLYNNDCIFIYMVNTK